MIQSRLISLIYIWDIYQGRNHNPDLKSKSVVGFWIYEQKPFKNSRKWPPPVNKGLFFYYAKKRTWNLDKNILYANKDFIRNMLSQIGMWFLPLNIIESLVQHSDGIGGDFERTEEYPTLLGVAGGGSSLVGDSLASGRRCSCTEANLKGCEML